MGFVWRSVAGRVNAAGPDRWSLVVRADKGPSISSHSKCKGKGRVGGGEWGEGRRAKGDVDAGGGERASWRRRGLFNGRDALIDSGYGRPECKVGGWRQTGLGPGPGSESEVNRLQGPSPLPCLAGISAHAAAPVR